MTGASRPRATVREVPRRSTADPSPSWRPDPSRVAVPDRSEARGAFAGLRQAWHSRLSLRLIAAVGLVVVGVGFAVGLSAIDFAVLAVTAVVAVVADMFRGAVGVAIDAIPGRDARSQAASVADGATIAAMIGGVVVVAVVIGGHLFNFGR